MNILVLTLADPDAPLFYGACVDCGYLSAPVADSGQARSAASRHLCPVCGTPHD